MPPWGQRAATTVAGGGRLAARIALCAALCASRSARAAETSGTARAELSAAVDTNAGRDLAPLARGDGLLQGELGLEGALATEGELSAAARYALGAKRFLTLHDDDLVAQTLDVEGRGAWALATCALRGRLKDRRTRGGERDYTSLGAGLSAARRVGRVGLSLEADAERFVYRPAAAYSYAGPRALLEATLPLTSHHRLTADLDGARHIYDPESLFAGAARRDDTVLAAGLAYRFKGAVLAGAGYGFLAVLSNQPGRSLQRHRLDGQVGLFLPGQIALAATAAVQRTRFPEGLDLSPELLLTTDDESTNSLTLSLSRRFENGLSLELRGAGYQADFAGNDLHYRRAVAQLALGWDGPP